VRKAVLYVAGITLAVAACFYAATSRAPFPPAQLPTDTAPGFDRALIARGTELAAIGNCDICHTAEGGDRLAGGRAISTPFGTIFSTNITPDRDTGLGKWSEAAFERAMREGVSRDGHYLYPAFPYDHFTHVTAQDNEALYAYLMSRPPWHAVAQDNQVWFPLKLRRIVALWNWFFLKKGDLPAESQQTAEWNRGAYLVNGLGHCGSCHTPRNILGAERSGRPLSGGRAEGWDAYALDQTSPAPAAWTIESLTEFLHSGWHGEHGVARGPMAPVTDDLGGAADADVRAMAVYIFSQLQGRNRAPPRPPAQFAASDLDAGAEVFAAGCAACHDGTRPLPYGGIQFELSSAVNAPTPRNVVLVTLGGLPPADGRASAIMPGFEGAMSDEELAALLEYLRRRFSDKPPWVAVASTIRAARHDLKREAQP
jgi:mono/diheme cytochrome c family protein